MRKFSQKQLEALANKPKPSVKANPKLYWRWRWANRKLGRKMNVCPHCGEDLTA